MHQLAKVVEFGVSSVITALVLFSPLKYKIKIKLKVSGAAVPSLHFVRLLNHPTGWVMQVFGYSH